MTTTSDLRDPGEPGAAMNRMAAERIVGELSIEKIIEIDHLFEPLCNLAQSVTTCAHAEFAEVGRSAASWARSFGNALAEISGSSATMAELEALQSYFYGDKSVFRSYVEERMGTKAALIRVRLHHHIDSYGDDLPLGYLPFLLAKYKTRSEQQKNEKGLARKTAQVREGINTSRYPSVDLALAALEQGQTR